MISNDAVGGIVGGTILLFLIGFVYLLDSHGSNTNSNTNSNTHSSKNTNDNTGEGRKKSRRKRSSNKKTIMYNKKTN